MKVTASQRMFYHGEFRVAGDIFEADDEDVATREFVAAGVLKPTAAEDERSSAPPPGFRGQPGKATPKRPQLGRYSRRDVQAAESSKTK